MRGARAAAPWLRRRWAEHGDTVLRIAIVLMAVASVVWLGYQFWRLVWGEAPIWPGSPTGAVDLKAIHRAIHAWFAGEPVYRDYSGALYPPASWVLLWPLLGWLDVLPARRLWAVATVAAVGALIAILVRESGARSRVERTFVALMPCAIYATGAATGNGQLIVVLLPLLVAAMLLLPRQRGRGTHLAAAALLLASLVKPTVSAPFVWLALFVPRFPGPVPLVTAGYGALTFIALRFQHSPLAAMYRDMQAHGEAQALVPVAGNVTNPYVWLAAFGLEAWALPVSLVILLLFGLWVYRHRRADIWILMGVAAYVARLWTYHRWYDDMLILLPMVALFRVAKSRPTIGDADVTAGVLLGLTLLLMLAPGGLFVLPPPWNGVYLAAEVTVWLAAVVFLAGGPWSAAETEMPPAQGT